MLHMLDSHAQTHLLVMLRWCSQLTHQQIEFLLDAIDDVLDALILCHSTCQTQCRCCLVHCAKSIGAWIIFGDALLTQQASITGVPGTGRHFRHTLLLSSLIGWSVSIISPIQSGCSLEDLSSVSGR